MVGFAPRVKAILGPTNTGKTHLAIERMLAHASGMIGFPLRLLARENYDRMVAIKGPRAVALITGEEKIVPPGARWFSCTTEAMPLDRAVEFLAVDEIQLCADPDRGHVFTERLLHARGLVETMFLGAETIRPLLRRLVPEAQVETRPRLSQLAFTGAAKLTRLPPRSAVVAFSAAEVYAIAELIRRRRGGCAVVMGRLSPRTRNAQVALYQAKEVEFLVATDAIGMGLNMDVDHVAFARLSKFDGHRGRPLAAAEIGQIAGRAGRGMRDGTFGTTADCPPMAENLALSVENHGFDEIGQVYWRNARLDFTSIEALQDSLAELPDRPHLIRAAEAVDMQTLAALSRDPVLRDLAQGRARVAALWEACQIPDFRKIADEAHTRLCGRVFVDVVRLGGVPAPWLAAQIEAVDRPDGDIDTLMQRLAGIRTCAYIAARADWVRDAPAWQGRAREVEDRLSDALHDRLLARFVDRRATQLLRRLDDGEADLLAAVTARGEVLVEGHPVGELRGFSFVPDPSATGEDRRVVLRAARRALREEIPRRVASLEASGDEAFTLAADRRIAWRGHLVGRLRPGRTVLTPAVEATGSEFLDGPLRERVRRRCQAFIEARIAAAMAPLLAIAARPDPATRGLRHRLVEGMGIAASDAATGVVEGLRGGRQAIFLPAMLKPAAQAMRALLWCVQRDLPVPALPPPGQTSLARGRPDSPETHWPEGFAAALGWIAAGPVLLRLDVAERIGAELAAATCRHAAVLPPQLASRLSVKPDLLPAVLRALGFRIRPAGLPRPELYGPPSPAMLSPLRPRPAIQPPTRVGSSFAALAVLRR